MSLQIYSHIFWDWNGTLLNDAWLCVEVMNSMLKDRKLPPITLDIYRELFDFPVKDYYLKLGFDFKSEPFEVAGMEFMVRYNQRQGECTLHSDVREVLNACQIKGYCQYILSAREEKELQGEVREFGIMPFFEKVCGLDDHYAHGKSGVGIRLLSEIGIPKEKILFIGDTRHDAEVATGLGINCLLIPNGHHHAGRFKGFSFPVLSSINDVIRRL